VPDGFSDRALGKAEEVWAPLILGFENVAQSRGLAASLEQDGCITTRPSVVASRVAPGFNPASGALSRLEGRVWHSFLVGKQRELCVLSTSADSKVLVSQPGCRQRQTLARQVVIVRLAHITTVTAVPPYAVSRTKRLMKTPKLYWGDTGLGLHLAGDPEPSGAHLGKSGAARSSHLAGRTGGAGRSSILADRYGRGGRFRD
jgi:hypothetical protein